MYKYFFSIAELKILLLSKKEIIINNLLKPFLCEETDYDIKCEIIEDMQSLLEVKEKGKRIYNDEIVEFYDYKDNTYRVFNYDDREFYVRFKNDNPLEFEIHTHAIDTGTIAHLHDLLCFDIACLKFDGIKIHASFVRYNGRAILFSAPSQTGKSTQARLWQENKNAEIINGDKAYLRRINGEWFAFGSPWAGTSGIYKSECADKPALAIIRQAPVNKITKLSPSKAVALILSQTHTQCWNEEDANKVCSLIEDFVNACPVFMLECRADVEAVEIVDNFLLNYRY